MIGSMIGIMGVLAYSSGPPDGRTGAPGETTCAVCHSGGTVAGSLFVRVLTPSWGPGDTVDMAVVLQDLDAQRWGFELTALDSAGTAAGEIIVTDPTHTQRSVSGGRVYLKHTSQGTFWGQSDSARWTFRWVVPNIPVVTFYVAGNGANGDGSLSGDAIYTHTLSLSTTSVKESNKVKPTAIRVKSVRGGILFIGGSPQKVVIWGVDGRRLGVWTVSGHRRIPLKSGVYWIQVGSRVQRVWVIR